MKKKHGHVLTILLAGTLGTLLGTSSAPTLSNAFCGIPVIHTPAELAALFPSTANAVRTLTTTTIKTVKKYIASMVVIPPEEKTFANTMVPLDRFRGLINATRSICYICSLAHANKAVRTAASDAHVQMRKFWVDCSMDPKIYASFQAYLNRPLQKEKLTDEHQRFITEMTHWFRESGMQLPPPQRQQLKNIRKEAIDRGTAFTETIQTDTRVVWADPDDLLTVNADILSLVKRDAAGRYRLNTSRQVYREIMIHGSPKIRAALWQEYAQTAYPQNSDNLTTFLRLRQQQADLFNVPNFTYLDLPDQMLSTAPQVHQFLDGLSTTIRPFFAMLLPYLGESVPLVPQPTAQQQACIQPWDWDYALHRFKELHLATTATPPLREYFPLKQTVQRIFAYLGKLLGITFTREPLTLWHQTVLCMSAHAPDGTLLGYILLDLCARPGKVIQTSYVNVIPTIWCTENGSKTIVAPAVSGVFAHFQTTETCQQTLLSLRDLGTLCHEIGHALHGLCGRSEMITFSGTRVSWDFLESASQIFELLICQPAVLQKIGQHYQTDDPLPEPLAHIAHNELVCDYVRDLYYIMLRAYFALAVFDGSLGNSFAEIKKTIHERLLPPMVAYNPADHFEMAFTHILTYGSMYYGYLLSHLIALMVIKKMDHSPTPTLGKQLAQDFLGAGGTRDPWIILSDFFGKRITLTDLYEALVEDLETLEPFVH